MDSRRVTSHDVARQAGVSRSVVSAVLNGTKGIRVSEETRRAVLEAIEQLNYHVDAQARGMKTGKSGCLAAYGDMRNPLFLHMLEGMQQACNREGYDLMICGHGQEPGEKEVRRKQLISLYLQRKIDGIVTLDATHYASASWAREVRKAKVPYVSVEGYAEDPLISSVQADYSGSVREALDYLRERGRPVPVYVELSEGDSRRNWAERSRREAYARWCEEQGARPVIIQADVADAEGFRILLRDGRSDPVNGSLANRTEEQQPRCFLTNWSLAAVRLYEAAWDLGLRMGEQLYVMSVDNTFRNQRHMVPTLACMEIPYARMGEQAVQQLLEQFEDSAAPVRKSQLAAKLLPGRSV